MARFGRDFPFPHCFDHSTASLLLVSAVLTQDADSPLYGKQLAWAAIFSLVWMLHLVFSWEATKGSFQAAKAGSYWVTANLQTESVVLGNPSY